MKRTKTSASILLSLITLTLLAALPGCKKSNGSSSSITAMINSTPFQSSSIYATFHPDYTLESFHLSGTMVASGDTSYLTLNFGLYNNGYRFQVNVPFSSDTTYDQLIYNAPNGIANYEAAGFSSYGYSSGTSVGIAIITISGYDSVGHLIAGTFSGTFINLIGGDSVIVANGKFNVMYVETN